MPQIDSTARIHPKAEIADDVVIGAYTVVDEHVRIGAGTVIDSHCVITGHTELGRNNHVFNHASVGTAPQDVTYRGEPTRLLVGDNNIIREFVTINRGTLKGGGITIIGNQCMFMACSHVAHDCCIGDRVLIANCALLAGHVKIEDAAVISGNVGIHHYATIGTVAMVGGLTGVTRDVPPFMTVMGEQNLPRMVNIIGMKRNGYTDTEIESVNKAFRLIYRAKGTRADAVKQLEAEGMMTAPARRLLDFLERSEIGKLGRFLESTRQERGGRA